MSVAPWLDGLGQDVRQAVRSLRRNPGLVAVSALSLGLGIGVNVILYVALSTIYFHQPTMTDPARVVGVEPGSSNQFSYPDYLDLERSGIFAGTAGFRASSMNLGGRDRVTRIGIVNVTANFFEVLGVSAARGRLFSAVDAAPERDPRVLVVTHDFWRARLQADPAAIGRTLVLNGEPFVVIGVLPEGYRAVTGFMAPQVYVPISRTTLPTLEERGSPSLTVLARLSDGASMAGTRTAVSSLGAALERAYPERNAGMARPADVFPAAEVQFRGSSAQWRNGAAMIGMTALLVLAIACVNVMGLLIARAATRRRELAIRVAVGAGRARVVQAMLVEGALLVVAGVAVGVPLAFALKTLPLPAPMADLRSVLVLDGRLVPFSLLVMVAATLACGLVPALRATRTDLLGEVRQSGSTSTPRVRLRQALVAGQMAMSLVLVVTALLFLRSQAHIGAVDVGFDLDHGVVARLGLDSTQYPGAERSRFADRLVEQIAAIPGVSSVAAANLVPLGGDSLLRSFHPAGRTDIPGTRPSTFSVGPSYFRTLGIMLLRGRDFDASHVAGTPVVAIVNETFARTYFPGGEAVGQRVQTGTEPEALVIGVARDHRIDTIGEAPKSVVYYPYAQRPAGLTIHARTAVAPDALVPAIAAAVDRLDPSLPVDVQTRRRAASLELSMRQAGTGLMGALGALGLALAAVGLYGVMAYVAASRTAEIGVRLALGASAGRVRREMLGRGVRVAGTGAMLGGICSLALVPVLRTFLAGVSPFDPVAFAIAIALLVITGVASSYLPAHRASSIDPMRALARE